MSEELASLQLPFETTLLLQREQIQTIMQVLTTPQSKIENLLGVMAAQHLYRIIASYNLRLLPTKASQLACMPQKLLSFGDPIIDSLFKGGLATQGITELSGPASSGKTQLCLQLCLTVQLPLSLGGLDGVAIYICTESLFPFQRLFQMMPRFQDLLPQHVFGDGIWVAHVSHLFLQYNLLFYQVPLLLEQFQGRAKLLVIDSIAANYRADQSTESVLERRERSLSLFELGQHLKKLSYQYGIAVVCINQVTAKMNSVSLTATENATATIGPDFMPALGNPWSNCVNERIMIRRMDREHGHNETLTSKPVRSLSIVSSPRLPSAGCYFEVNQQGVYGTCLTE